MASGCKLFLIEIHLLSTPAELKEYDVWVKSHPDGTLWQSVEWKEYQERLGREVKIYGSSGYKLRVARNNAGQSPRPEARSFLATAMVIIDRTTFGLSTWDIPRGPLVREGRREKGESEQAIVQPLLEKITLDALKDRCISIYLSPTQQLSNSATQQRSSRHEQPEATRIIDLTLSEEEIQKQMHQKGRYNIRVAEKKGVTVEESTDVAAYAELAKQTAKRDKFSGAGKKQYEEFLTLPGSFMLLAYTAATALELRATGNRTAESSKPEARSRTPIAGLIGIMWNNKAYYYYGASDYEHRNLMAPYALQWAAIKKCKDAECRSYDLLGIAPPASSHKPLATSHPWAGISSFKEKFGGEVVEYPGEQELVLKPFIKKLLKVKRAIV